MEQLQPNSRAMATATDIFHQHPFATLLVARTDNETPGSEMPEVVHLPFLYNANDHCFYLHAATNNPIIELINSGQNQVKVVFNGEHGYVSPTWSEHIRVPTWDYCVVHVSGNIEIVENPDEKYQSMVEQIAAFESEWQITTLNEKKRIQMFKAIRVLRVNVDAMHYRYKMSQAKHVDAKAAITEQFTARGNTGLVARYEDVF